jgi:hypothetical protein
MHGTETNKKNTQEAYEVMWIQLAAKSRRKLPENTINKQTNRRIEQTWPSN